MAVESAISVPPKNQTMPPACATSLFGSLVVAAAERARGVEAAVNVDIRARKGIRVRKVSRAQEMTPPEPRGHKVLREIKGGRDLAARDLKARRVGRVL